MDEFKKFIVWESATRDTIDVKRCYIDITGDLVSGVLLSQIIYWFLPNRKHEMKLSVFKDGCYWLCKERTEWWDECRVTEYQFDRAIKQLEIDGFVKKKIYKFNAVPKVHVTVNIEQINKALVKLYKTNKELLENNLGLANLLKDVVIEPTVKESYLARLKGVKLELYNRSLIFLKKKEHLASDVDSDVKLKEFIFEHFWEIYENKQRKARALKAFKRLTFQQIELVLNVVPEYVAKTPKYRLLPHNYLNDESFNDVIKVYESSAPKIANEEKFHSNVDKDTDDYFSKFKK